MFTFAKIGFIFHSCKHLQAHIIKKTLSFQSFSLPATVMPSLADTSLQPAKICTISESRKFIMVHIIKFRFN